MKIYVIEKGAYSDHRVIGVALTKERADAIAKIASDRWNTAYYSTWESEQFETALRFYVQYDYGDWTVEYDDLELYPTYKENTALDCNRFVVFADSLEKAVKIAQDMRAEIIYRDEIGE